MAAGPMGADAAFGPTGRIGSRLGFVSVIVLAAALWVVLGHVGGENAPLLIATAIVAAVAITLWISRSPIHGLLLLVVSLPLVAVGVIEMGWSVRPAQMVVMMLIPVWLIAWRSDWRDLPLRGWMALYVLSLVFAALWGYLRPPGDMVPLVGAVAQRASGVRPLVQLLTNLLALAVLPITILAIAGNQRNLSRAVKVFLAVTALVALYGLYQPIAAAFGLPLSDLTWGVQAAESATTNYGETRYYSGIVTSFAPRSTFAESLHFGAYLAGAFPLCLAGWLGRRSLPESWRRWHWGLLTLVIGSALLLTFSRSSWIAGALGALLVLIMLRRFRFWAFAITGGGVLSAAFFVFTRLSIFEPSLSPLALIGQRLAVDQMLSDPRAVYLPVLAQTALAHPILGVGLGNYALIGAAQLGLDTILSAHSVWLAHWVEGGLVGLLVVAGLMVAILWRLKRGLSQLHREANNWFVPLAGLMAGILAMGLQYLTWGDRFDPYFWFIAALGVVISGFASVTRAREIRQTA